MIDMIRSRRAWLCVCIPAALLLAFVFSQLADSGQHKRLDPAAWGGDHVGKPLPEYVTGDECLFCHRKKIGPTWGENRHNLTIRRFVEQEPTYAALKQSSLNAFADEIEFVLGDKRRQRFLKPAKAYGKLDLLSVEWIPGRGDNSGKLSTAKNPHWDGKKFGASCAGCHTTAVDSKKQSFSAVSLDCFVCHGNVNLDHSKKPELVYLAKKRKDPARLVISICAQCHVRNGKSKSSGLPYANNFVAGDNLFRDFQVDFSDDQINAVSMVDKHILENVRDVVVHGKEKTTCLTCHDVHARSSVKHRRLAANSLCLNCHHAEGPKRKLKSLTYHSKTCGY